MDSKYLKNADIARKYNVSTATVTRWFRLALENKNKIELIKLKNKYAALNTPLNISEFERLAELGRKYKISDLRIKTEPLPEFYKLLSKNDIVELIKNIEEKNLIDVKYLFIGNDALNYNTVTESKKKISSTYNNDYYQFITKHILLNVIELIQTDNVSIIDMCTGNGKVVTPILNHISQYKKIDTYHALDFSNTILKSNRLYIEKKFKNLKYKNTRIDLEKNSIYNKVNTLDYFNSNRSKIFINIGDTFNNFRDPKTYIKNVSTAMNKGDLFILSTNTNIIESASRLTGRNKNEKKYTMYFDYMYDYDIFKLLGVNVNEFVSFIEVDKTKYSRGFQFNKDYIINFKTEEIDYSLEISSGSVLNILKLETYDNIFLNKLFIQNNLKTLRYIDNGVCSGIYILKKT